MLYWICETILIALIRSTGFFIFIGKVYPFLHPSIEFSKNANSIYVGVVNPYT